MLPVLTLAITILGLLSFVSAFEFGHHHHRDHHEQKQHLFDQTHRREQEYYGKHEDCVTGCFDVVVKPATLVIENTLRHPSQVCLRSSSLNRFIVVISF